MPDNEKRSVETVEKELDDVRKKLNELLDEIKDSGVTLSSDKQKIDDLKKERDKLQAELSELKGGVSPSSIEKFGKNDKDAAKKYLEQIKDKSWNDIVKEGGKWISAIQVMLGVKPDGFLGRRTKAAVKKFQKNNRLRPLDGLPGPKTINAILGFKVDNSTEKKGKNKEQTKKDDYGVFKGELDANGNPLTGEYTANDGTKIKIKNGKKVDNSTEKKGKSKEQTKKDDYGVFKGELDANGNPLTGEYTANDGTKIKIKNGKKVNN